MTELSFDCVDVTFERYAVAPTLLFRLRLQEAEGQRVRAIALRCQFRIEPQRRGYSETEETGLRALFGERDRWAQTLKPFLWMQCNTTIQGFTGLTEVELPMPCSYDFDVVGSRFLHAVEEGTVALSLLFSGTVFTKGLSGFGVEQVPWDCDATYRLPVAVWRQMIDLYYPNTGWIRLDRDVVAQVADYRARHGLTSWEETVQRLLAHEGEVLS